MKRTSKNKLAMYKSVRTVLAQHSNIWNQLGAMLPIVDSFEMKVAQLEQLAYTQVFATLGASEAKRATLAAALDKACAMGNSMKAYAIVSNNPGLLAMVPSTRSDFRKGGILGTLQRIDLLLEKANAHLSELGLYGVDQSGIDVLQDLRNALELHNQSPRNAQIERRVATVEMYTLEREIDLILRNQLDALVNVLRTSAPAFFTAYTSARVIVDAHHGSVKNVPPEPDDGSTRE